MCAVQKCILDINTSVMHTHTHTDTHTVLTWVCAPDIAQNSAVNIPTITLALEMFEVLLSG